MIELLAKAPLPGFICKGDPEYVWVWIPDRWIGESFKAERKFGYRMNIRVRKR